MFDHLHWLCLGRSRIERACAAIFVSILVSTTGYSVAGDVNGHELLPIDGDPFPATLLSSDESWNLTFRTPEGEKKLNAADLVLWGAAVEPKWKGRLFANEFPPAHLLLADGGMLPATILKSEGDRLTVESQLVDEEIVIPLDRLAGILFNPPGDAAARDRLEARLRDGAADADRLILRQTDDVLRGRVVRFFVGTLEGGEAKIPQVEFKTDAATVSLPADRIAGVAFNPKLARSGRKTGLWAMVGLSDGARLPAAALKIDEGQAEIKLAGDVVLATAAENIVFLQPFGGKATYLSDLEPSQYTHVPFLTLPWDYARDKSVVGTRLRAGGNLYEKGLGLHSTAQIGYRLTKPYRRFEAELAIDDAAENRGSVQFRIIAVTPEGNREYKSPVVCGGDPPLAVSLDLTGATGIAIQVSFAERGDERDYADVLNARLVE